MNSLIKVLVTIILGGVIIWTAVITMPETDYCTPDSIAHYTNVVIAHQECIALGAQCVIIPHDIEKYHNNQLQLHECIMQLVETTTENDPI